MSDWQIEQLNNRIKYFEEDIRELREKLREEHFTNYKWRTGLLCGLIVLSYFFILVTFIPSSKDIASKCEPTKIESKEKG